MAEQLVQIIQNLIGDIDQTVQKQAEAALITLSEQDPNTFSINLLQIAIQHTQDNIRIFAISHLRKRISKFSEKSFSLIWDKLAPQNQNTIKTALFEMLTNEKNNTVRGLICDCIGELGGSLLEDKDAGNQWPELISIVWSLFMKESVELLESGFKILTNLLTYAPDSFDGHKQELATLFQNGVKNVNAKIQVACIQSIGAYISMLDPKQAKLFQPLVPLMLESFYTQIKQSPDDAEEILIVFTDIAETEPKFFKEHFEYLFSTIWKVNMEHEDVETDVKHMGTETIISLIQRLPQIVRKNPAYISRLIEMIFKHMIEIDEEITDEWKKPAEGFNEDIEEDADFETTRFGMNAIDRIIDSVGDAETLPILSATVEKLLQHNDWRYNFSAIMALSQVGEYIDDVATVQPIVDTVLKFLNNENPMLRYAVFHAIGQISDDMKPDFQVKYKDNIMPILLKYLDDPVPRVVSHAAAALTNFVEGFSDDDITPYLQQTLQKLFTLVNTGCSIVKENCMTAIASTAESAKAKFHDYFNECIPILFNVFETYTSKEYKQLRGQTIECITLIAHSINKEVFLPHLQKITQIIVTVQNSNLDNQDPQKSYVLSGWQRLCLNYSNELVPYLPEIVPGVFRLVEQITKKDGEDGYDVDEAEIALAMLEVFIDQFNKNFAPYVESTTRLISPLLDFKYAESIRESASKCVPGLVKCAGDNHEIQKNMVRYFLQLLLDATSTEFDSTIMITQISAIRDCIDSAGKFMTQEELQSLSNKVIKLLLDSDKRKAENEKWKNDEEVEEDEKEILEDDLEMEEELQVAIAELIGILFKTHKEQTLQLADLIYTQVLPKVLDPTVSDRMHKFGLFLIDDMVEFLGFELMSVRWNELATALKMFAQDKSCQVRQAAVYGIGIFAQNTPNASFTPYAQDLISTLIQSSNIPQGEEKEKQYGHARDNAIASIGKIIKSQSIVAPEVITYWISNLPLKYDKPEAHIQHQLLAEICISRPDLLSTDLITKTIQIFGQILETKYLDQQKGAPLVSQALKVLAQNPHVTAEYNKIISVLTEQQQEKLKKAFQA
ncbi:importin protein (macronuclear) [Tetrahymena thermophila SB210]|uniref:Importin protein n=1 Tax=Tetrahymena thermophila (strain SB210) TaxID=312017 RepID=Q22UQ4_TETTS|nr:importin protein [Tetrahymena thermophila SB210]EAR88916.3 importin protein [Tetrahymena thermophila SB210]|eukprot:XP_001009161.3 importin protein [Tetrahymena thermophila SB210]